LIAIKKTLTDVVDVIYTICSFVERKSMIEYKLIREIERNPFHTQRSLATTLHISLGKANYLISGLIHKGIIKVRKLRNNPEKIRWKYILTPKGIREKLTITRDYLQKRITDFEIIQREIAELKTEVDLCSSRPRSTDKKISV
jgi:EPS-associated MarR family transcriptional regulator